MDLRLTPYSQAAADVAAAPHADLHSGRNVSDRARFQHTIGERVTFTGVGLHTGAQIRLTLIPAPADHGLRFFRTDLMNGARLILPQADRVTDTRLCTLISNDHGGHVGTIEHLMAALHALGVSNCLIELDGPEVPILDGSSAPFVRAIEQAGLVQQNTKQTYLRIRRDVKVSHGMSHVHLAPLADQDDTRLHIDFTIDFAATCIGRQTWATDITAESFATQMSAARTFGFTDQVDALQKQGLVKGGSLNNAIIVKGDKVANPEGLRFTNEFVRHKALDAVGDLFTQGLPLIGAYTGECAGHEMTNRAMRALMADPENYDLVTI